MSRATKVLILVSSATLIGAPLICLPLKAQGEVKTLFKPDETIETLTVKIDVGKGGEALDEPVALDLGLGFPLWLYPLGRKAGEFVPFGAIPQQTAAGATLAAGSSGTFTFSIKGKPGQDELQTTPQLLAGVRVSDIARVGLASEGKSNWVLAGFEIQINGKVFASQSGLNQSVKAVQQAALSKQQELMKELVPILQRAGNGRSASDQGASPRPADKLGAEALDTQAYSPADREKITNFLRERQRLEGLLRGVYPWFEDAGFRSPWRASANVKTAKATVETAAHAGADTRNYVYLRGGGHKYLLGSPEIPLSAEKGPQTFTLDLIAGPLTAADLRGWAVGMLAHPHRQGLTPDRWHPHRIMVEIDGQIIYDSEESALDRLSLEAIRLIPPAHRGREGAVVRNTPVAREAFVWEAGKGAGLDLSHGGALALPGKDDPTFPRPEPGLEDVPPASGSDQGAPATGGEPTLPAGFDPFPGEPAPGAGWPGGNSNAPGSQPAPGQPAPPSVDPPAAGEPFQVESVWIASGWKADDNFAIEWRTTGDVGAIDHFDVALLPVSPEKATVYGSALLQDANVPKDRQRYVFSDKLTLPKDVFFVSPVVVAVPKDPAKSTPDHTRIGPARAVFPAGAKGFPALQLEKFSYQASGQAAVDGSISPDVSVAGTQRAVWLPEQADGHNAILFGSAKPGLHVAIRPEQGDTLRVHGRMVGLVGAQRLTAHAGFLGGVGQPASMEVELTCQLQGSSGSPHSYPPVTRKLASTGAMELFDQVVNAADAGGSGPCTLTFTFTFRGGDFDPAHPPALFGLRLTPSAVTVPYALANADLEIVADKTYLIPGKMRGPGIQLTPVIQVRNNGPEAIPENLARTIIIRTRYWVREWGENKADAEIVECLNPIWTGTGAWPKDTPASITPTSARLPGGVFLEWEKLFWVEAEIMLPPDLTDPNLDNNKYTWDPQKAINQPYAVLGDGPGPYEVILWTAANYKGPQASVECPPTYRQRLLPTLPASLTDYKGQGRLGSFQVGARVAVWGWKNPNFETDEELPQPKFDPPIVGPLPHGAANLGDREGKIASLIIVPDFDSHPSRIPMGVDVRAGGTITSYVPPVNPMLPIWPFLTGDGSGRAYSYARFFPLPEKKEEKEAKYPDLGRAGSNADSLFLMPNEKGLGWFKNDCGGWAVVELYKDRNFAGASLVVPSHGWYYPLSLFPKGFAYQVGSLKVRWIDQ